MTALQNIHIFEPAPYRILIVEDDPRHRKLQRAIFDKPKYKITEVEDGKQAIAAIQANDYDLVLLDKQMPVQTGDETLYRI